MNTTEPIQILSAQIAANLAEQISQDKTKQPQPVIIVADPPERIVSQFAYYTIKALNTVEIPFPGILVNFNKLWVYPGIKNGISGSGILSTNANTVYIGERGDGSEVCVDALAPGDLPFKLELPQGKVKSVSELLVYGNVGDGIFIKYWMLQ